MPLVFQSMRVCAAQAMVAAWEGSCGFLDQYCMVRGFCSTMACALHTIKRMVMLNLAPFVMHRRWLRHGRTAVAPWTSMACSTPACLPICAMLVSQSRPLRAQLLESAPLPFQLLKRVPAALLLLVQRSCELDHTSY